MKISITSLKMNGLLWMFLFLTFFINKSVHSRSKSRHESDKKRGGIITFGNSFDDYYDDFYCPGCANMPKLPVFNRNGVLNRNRLWVKGEIPYVIDYIASQADVIFMKKIMKDLEEMSCLRFRPRIQADQDFVVMRFDGVYCNADTGRMGGAQMLYVNKACMDYGYVLHLFLHLAGFDHEHNTIDRDDYITVHWENILPGYESKFQILDRGEYGNYGIDFDYLSIMHYDMYRYSKNGLPTLSVRIGRNVSNCCLGQRIGLSQGDIMKLRRMYLC